MEALICSILIVASLGVLFTGFLQFIYHIPVSLSVLARSENGSFDIEGSIGWGPLNIRVFLEKSEFEGEIWLFRIPVSHLPLKGEEKRQEPTSTPTTEMKQKDLDIARFIPLAWRILPTIINHLSIGRFNGDITFGTGDPVTTGEMFGYYHSVRPLLDSDSFSCSLKPDFSRLMCAGYAEGEILITRPLGLIIKTGATLIPFFINDRTSPEQIPKGKNHA